MRKLAELVVEVLDKKANSGDINKSWAGFENANGEEFGKDVDKIIELAKEILSGENQQKEQVNHPDHYNSYPIEVIDMMIHIWGHDAVKLFCEINAFKYRMRMGLKEYASQDLEKEQWYLNKAKEL